MTADESGRTSQKNDLIVALGELDSQKYLKYRQKEILFLTKDAIELTTGVKCRKVTLTPLDTWSRPFGTCICSTFIYIYITYIQLFQLHKAKIAVCIHVTIVLDKNNTNCQLLSICQRPQQISIFMQKSI